MMEQREKLIKLITAADDEYVYSDDDKDGTGEIAYIADHLIANCVVLLPCKVGTAVFAVEREYCDRRELDKCDEYCDGWDACCERNNAPWYVAEHEFRISMMDRIGKSAFLTQEEAEKALEKRKGNRFR